MRGVDCGIPACMSGLSRRDFLAASAVAAAGAGVGVPRASGSAGAFAVRAGGGVGGPVVIASHNGLAATARAMELLKEGYDPADAVVQGVKIMEDDPEEDSVGLGGLPNAEGVVQLDASVMHGPTHKSGAVAGIENIKNPAQVALMVLRRTDHCLLVGEGAYRYAISMGFKHENLLTEHARLEWLNWKENMSRDDDWLNDEERDGATGKTWDLLPWQNAPTKDTTPRNNDGPDFREQQQGSPKKTSLRPYTMDVTGTVHCSALTAGGDIASCTSTSGLNWKIPGRVGDSPIIGAGNYCDNAVGAAGATGRGEAAIVNLAAARMVDMMAGGMTPQEACMSMAKQVIDRTREKRLWKTVDGKRLPTFNLKLYALRKDGLFGGASLWSGDKMAVCDASGHRAIDMPHLYERPAKK